jgi:hypothetical protein
VATGDKLKNLEVNVPRCGTLSAVYFVLGKQYPTEDLKLVGDWEPGKDFSGGKGFFYLPYACAPDLAAAGLISNAGIDTRAEYRGQPKFNVVDKNQRLVLDKKADGVVVAAVDRNGKRVQLRAQDAPPPPPSAGAPAQQEQQAGGSGGDVLAPPAPGQQTAAAAATSAAATAQASAPAERPREWYLTQWSKLGEAHVTALRIALRGYLDIVGQSIDDFKSMEPADKVAVFQVIAPQCSTLMIRAESMGLTAYLGIIADVDRIGSTGGPKSAAALLFKRALTGEILAPPPPQPEKKRERATAGVAAGKAGPGEAGDYPEALDADDDDLPF